MNTGNSVREADPRCAVTTELPGLEALQEATQALPEPSSLTLAEDEILADEESAAWTPPSFQHVHDIQELIDKLAAVTKQLHRPGHS